MSGDEVMITGFGKFYGYAGKFKGSLVPAGDLIKVKFKFARRSKKPLEPGDKDGNWLSKYL